MAVGLILSDMRTPGRLTLSGLSLLALVPVVAFALGRPAPVVGLSVVSVVLITASIYLMFAAARRAGPESRASG